MDKSILASLSRADWSSVQHAYGPATDVPDLLRSLVSDDDDVRNKARWELYGNVIHQNTRFSATPEVIPHLMELIGADGVPDKADLLRYLTNLIAGPYTVRDGFWVCDGDRTVAYDDEQAEIALACYQAALPGIPTLLELADGAQAAIRAGAIAVLGCFRTHRGMIVPRIQRRAAVETAASVRAAAAFALALLTEGSPEFEATVRPFHEQDPSSLVRVTAAIMLALYGFGDEPVVQTLVDGLTEIDLRRRYVDLPWGHERLLGDIGHALAEVPAELGVRAIPALGAALRVVDRHAQADRMSLVQVIGLVKAMNALAFPNGGVPALSPVQREAVTALVLAESPWTVGNVVEAYREMGLSSDRAENAALVGIDIDAPAEPSVDEQVDSVLDQIVGGEAESALAALLELPDDHPFVAVNRGRALMALGRHAEGIQALEHTTERFPDFAIGWNILACAYDELDRNDDALSAVDNAVRFNSDSADYYYNRVLFRFVAGDVEGALADARETADREPTALAELEQEPVIAALVQDPRWETARLIAG